MRQKELLLAQLAPNHPAVASLPAASRTPRSPRFCRLVLREMVVWFNWLIDQHAGRLAEVTQAHCGRIADFFTMLDDAGVPEIDLG